VAAATTLSKHIDLVEAAESMFVHDFTEITAPADVVASRLAAHAWDRARAPELIDVGTPRARGDATLVPVLWEVRDDDGRVALLIGDLEVAPVDHEHAIVTLHAGYTPPRDRPRDDAGLHRRVARATRQALDRLGAACALEEVR
jgi:hypothetical protein